MGTLRVVLGDQCSAGLSALSDLDPAADTVLMAEVMRECTYVRHHQKKIVLVLSAMRHFARALQARGVAVAYVALDDPANTHSMVGEVARAAARLRPARIVATECGEWRLDQEMQTWHEATGLEVEIRTDTRFLSSIREFRAWAQGKRSLRMEFFYREMRRRYGVLMEDGAPVEGRWNFDAENRKPLPARVDAPPPPHFQPDAITQDVIALVRARFGGHFGTCDGFNLPVTAADAKAALGDFVLNRLPQFGDWQDAMRAGAPTLFHALISTSLNTGLLEPLEVCMAAGGRVPGGTGAAERGGGVHPPGARLARVRARDLLAEDARVCPAERFGGNAQAALALLGREHADELHAPCGDGHAGARLRPPHSAPDGDGELRPVGRAGSGGGR